MDHRGAYAFGQWFDCPKPDTFLPSSPSIASSPATSGASPTTTATAASWRAPFPFPPYDSQRHLIGTVRSAVEEGRHNICVVESPTGTGKTLCLLSGTLSWLSSKRKPRVPKAGGGSEVDVQAAHRRVIYASRTHSQLAQAMEEMQRLPFSAALMPTSTSTSAAPLRSLVDASTVTSSTADAEPDNSTTAAGVRAAGGCRALRGLHCASRSQLCIFSKLKAYTESSGGGGGSARLNDLCKLAVEGQQMLEKKLRKQQEAAMKKSGGGGGGKVEKGTVMTTNTSVTLGSLTSPTTERDVEDLIPGNGRAVEQWACPYADPEGIDRVVEHLRIRPRSIAELRTIGEKVKGCPFFATQRAVIFSDVLFMPYPYLLDRRLLTSVLLPDVPLGDEGGPLSSTLASSPTVGGGSKKRHRASKKSKRAAKSRRDELDGVTPRRFSSSSSSSSSSLSDSESRRRDRSTTTAETAVAEGTRGHPAGWDEDMDNSDSSTASEPPLDRTLTDSIVGGGGGADDDEDPINQLLSKSVLVIDEAHNIADAASSVSSVSVGIGQLQESERALKSYMELYESRLVIRTKQMLRQLINAIGKLSAFMLPSPPGGHTTLPTASPPLPLPRSTTTQSGAPAPPTRQWNRLTPFVFDAGVDNVNFFDLVKLFDERADLSRRVAGAYIAAMEVALAAASGSAGGSGAGMSTAAVVGSPATKNIHSGGGGVATTTTAIIGSSNVKMPSFTTVVASLFQVAKLMKLLAEAQEENVVIIIHAPTAAAASATPTNAAPSGSSSSMAAPVELYVGYLSPAPVMEALTVRSRCTIMAGGTMQPFDVLVKDLFPHYEWSNIGGGGGRADSAGGAPNHHPSLRLRTCTFPHVVPQAQFGVVVVASGPSDVPFRFTFEQKPQWPAMLTECGRSLLTLSRIIPAGIVVFLPSFLMLQSFLDMLRRPGVPASHGARPEPSLYDQLRQVKTIFIEEQGVILEGLLRGYTEAIHHGVKNRNAPDWDGRTPTGAILMSVMGGRLSEGINFSDDLARCVCVMGMPYPHRGDPRLASKLAYLDRPTSSAISTGVVAAAAAISDITLNPSVPVGTPVLISQPAVSVPRLGGGGAAAAAGLGNKYYESLCSRSVNQSIGRCLRHRGDYACIVLMDARYLQPGALSSLPGWLQPRVLNAGAATRRPVEVPASQVAGGTSKPGDFHSAFRAVRQFFIDVQQQQQQRASSS